MSNENSSSNAPPKRFRNFALMTYLSAEQIEKVLIKHDRQLKSYAYCLHDKDINEFGQLKEVHTHLLLCLVNNTTCDSVKNWFKGFTDDKQLPINTLAQPMHDISGSYDYLTHNTEQARDDGKYIYQESDIKGFNLEYFQDTSIQDQDNLTLALVDLQNGVLLSEIAKRYGRDFIVHYGHIKQLFNDIQKQTGGELL